MIPRHLLTAAIPLMLCWMTSLHAIAQEDHGVGNSVRELLGKYCSQCHNSNEAEGDFDLAELSAQEVDRGSADRWEQVAEALQGDYMPPEDSPQPTAEEKRIIREWIKFNFASRQPIQTLRRMNRVEYENTIRDLFRLKRDAFANPNKILRIDEYFSPQKKKLPRYVFAIPHFAFPDLQRPELLEVASVPIDLPAERGYTNDVQALQFSPLLAEKYIQLGREIVNSPTLPAVSDNYVSLFVFDSNADLAALKKEVRQRLAKFLPRAFRRPVAEEEVDRFAGVFAEQFDETSSVVEAMKSAISTALISPDFLLLFQQPGESLTLEQRKSLANASRLSYFLWASMPDDELLALATDGKLTTSAQLRTQTKRMMLDPKVKSLATDFGMQWLKVSRLTSSQPDAEKFSKFYSRKKQPIGISMMVEQLLFFEAILVEDRSILEFIDSDFAYLNRDLLFWYGFNPDSYVGYTPPNSSPEDFFRIKFREGHLRGGAITAGSTLVLTSTTHRTSPVIRGAWISEAIFNRPLPSPPPNVPALGETEAKEDGKVLTVREQLAIHRKDPNCYSCHAKIDPLGFGLEGFDAVGRIRKKYENGESIDSNGEFEGQEFSHASGLKQLILESKKELYIRAFVEHVLRYAVNRKLTIADSSAIDQITKAVVQENCRFHAVIENVILSESFRAQNGSTDNGN